MKKTLLIVFTTLLFSQAKAQMYLIDKISLPATNEVFGFYTDINVEENDCIYFDLQTPDPQQKARANSHHSKLILFSLPSKKQQAFL